MKAKTAFKVFCIIVGAGLLLLLTNFALSLLNEPSTVLVAIGAAILVLEVLGLIVFVPKIYRSFKKDAKIGGAGSGSTAMSLLALALILPLTGGLGGCMKQIKPGYEGIKVNNYGDNRGVSDIPLSTGAVWYNPFTESVLDYPTFVQTAVWTKDSNEGKKDVNQEISFNTKDNVLVTVDVSLSYQLDSRRIPAFYVKFRSDDLDAFTDGFLHNIARDAFNEIGGNYTVEDVNSIQKAAFLSAVRNRINEQTRPFGVELQQFGLINGMRVPDGIQAAMNAKVTAIQKAQQSQNELIQSQADAAKAVAKARGEAEANQELAKSLSPELIQWRQMDIIDKHWNGAYPLYMSGGSQGTPLIALPTVAHK